MLAESQEGEECLVLGKNCQYISQGSYEGFVSLDFFHYLIPKNTQSKYQMLGFSYNANIVFFFTAWGKLSFTLFRRPLYNIVICCDCQTNICLVLLTVGTFIQNNFHRYNKPFGCCELILSLKNCWILFKIHVCF